MSLVRNLAPMLAAALLALPARADVPPNTPYVESGAHPIRVYYASPAPQSQADALLAQLDAAWDAEIGGMGFAVPLRVLDGQTVPGFHMLIEQTDASIAYTFAVQGDYPDTPQADCAILGIASTDFLALGTYYQDTAWHVLNHASLHAIDCLEMSVPTNDIFSIGVEMTQGVVPPDYFKNENDTFQRLPEWSLDAVAGTIDDVYYSFGSALYALFLEERFGARDGKLLAEIWTHTPEDGHITGVDSVNTELVTADVPNSPNWFDAIAAVMVAKGSSFDEAYEEFAIWRLLVGDWDDGQHFKDAATYAIPALTATVDPTTLPIKAVHPTKLVARYGTSYLLVDSTKIAPATAVKLSVTGLGSFHWAAQAVCVLDGQPAEVTEISFSPLGLGSALVPEAARCKAVVLAVENLSEGSYTPDKMNWQLEGDYQYSISAWPMPTLSSVSPAVLHPGDTGVVLTATGTQLTSGPKLAAAFSASGVDVATLSPLSDDSLSLTVNVAADAPLGPRDLTVTNDTPLSVTLANAISVELPADAGAPGLDAATAPEGADASVASAGADASTSPKEKAGGCGCASAGTAPLLLGLLALAGALRRRRC